MLARGQSFNFIFLALAGLSGCQAPHFAGEHRTPAIGPAPTIEPLSQVLAVGGTPEIAPEDPAALQSRADALKARSDAIAAQTTDQAERERLMKAAGAGG